MKYKISGKEDNLRKCILREAGREPKISNHVILEGL
jgi:hypothetical protein